MSERDPSEDWDAYALELGLRLQRTRIGLGLSQESVAHRAGISTFTYRKLEKGESNPGTPANPRLRTLRSIAQVFGLATGELLPDDRAR